MKYLTDLEYWDGNKWISAGKGFFAEKLAWISLGGDDFNYRTIDADSGKVLTDKSQGKSNGG